MSIWQFSCLFSKKHMTLARTHNRDTDPLILERTRRIIWEYNTVFTKFTLIKFLKFLVESKFVRRDDTTIDVTFIFGNTVKFRK